MVYLDISKNQKTQKLTNYNFYFLNINSNFKFECCTFIYTINTYYLKCTSH
jgi:hypothetical protein